MKHIIFTLLICFLSAAVCTAQTAAPPPQYFDPERDPVAVQVDSSFQLIVSEYVLARSLRARMGQAFRVKAISKTHTTDGAPCLIVDGEYRLQQTFGYALMIRLLPDAGGRYYYAAAAAEKVCEAQGCSNCTVAPNGNCQGCCAVVQSMPGIAMPFLKVSTKIED